MFYSIHNTDYVIYVVSCCMFYSIHNIDYVNVSKYLAIVDQINRKEDIDWKKYIYYSNSAYM